MSYKEIDLDPQDWDAYSIQAHRLLDNCIERMKSAHKKPWQEVDQEARKKLTSPLPNEGIDIRSIIDILTENVMPYATGGTHPRFWGWVHGSGTASGLLAEMTAATMNSNCGGRDHGAIKVEQCLLNWCKDIFGFSHDASGVMTVGTSQATILAMVTARARLMTPDNIRKNGIGSTKYKVYCADGAHSCIAKALEIMGHGSQSLKKIPTAGPSGPMNMNELREQINIDRQAGFVPMAIVGTAGSVNTGAFDDLNAIADFCLEQDIWMHVDGAFGAWIKLAELPWSSLVRAIDRANSLAFDFHKWISVPYACGAILMKDANLHYKTFATRPDYLAAQDRGLGAGDFWPADYGMDLSRGFTALKVWVAIQAHGLDNYSKVITQNCRQAKYMGEIVIKSDKLTLCTPIIANVCVFRAVIEGMDLESLNAMNSDIVYRLQENGMAVFSTTKIEGYIVIRAAIVNHKTRMEDIDLAIDSIIRLIPEYT